MSGQQHNLSEVIRHPECCSLLLRGSQLHTVLTPGYFHRTWSNPENDLVVTLYQVQPWPGGQQGRSGAGLLGGDRNVKGKGGLQEREFFNSPANILRRNRCLSAEILLQGLKT